jgi:hypothetical protein
MLEKPDFGKTIAANIVIFFVVIGGSAWEVENR